MAFLTEDDYRVQITDWVKDLISHDDTAILELAEQSAQEEMETYLNNRFDTALIFDPDQENRSQLIVMYMVDIALYHLHSNVTPSDVPEIRQIRYDSAIRWLTKVNESKLTPNLPLIGASENEDGETDTDDALAFEAGSNTNYTERY